MPVEYAVNLGYKDIYDNYEQVDVQLLLEDISTIMILEVIAHYTAQVHTLERNTYTQIKAVQDWSSLFPNPVKLRINLKVDEFTSNGNTYFVFINNVSSLYLTEFALKHQNNLPIQNNLTPAQEENLFKAYLYFSQKWTTEQEVFMKENLKKPPVEWLLPLKLPYEDIFSLKDFRLQFIKAIYFFKFCEENELFNGYLQHFTQAREVANWKEYLRNVLSVYVTCLGFETVKSKLGFEEEDADVFAALLKFCVNIGNFEIIQDFQYLRNKPIYQYSENELLFLNFNFFIDKIYKSILFDFGAALVNAGQSYKGKIIGKVLDFIGIYGSEFVESGLFYKVVSHVFRRKGYLHFTGDGLKAMIGAGTPDYVILDNKKAYIFEFKNTLFSAKAKYSYNIEEIKKEIYKKLVRNDDGHGKGVTQLVNTIADFENGRYDAITDKPLKGMIIYPIIVTTDFSFNLPVVNSIVDGEFRSQVENKGLNKKNKEIHNLTIIDIDDIIKFQDLFIEKKLALNHVLKDYQRFLSKGKDNIERSLSFNNYIHDKTANLNYDTPKLFFKEIETLL